MKQALVTGGGGFLGGAIVRKLLRQDVVVRSFSRGSYPTLKRLGVEEVRGDLADRGKVIEACEGCDTVFHVAAKAGIWGPYREYYRANVIGTENVIAACRTHKIPRLVYTSSPSVIFDGTDMEGIDESIAYPDKYKAAYPQTKAAAERLVLEQEEGSPAAVALRPHLIWGPGDTHLIPGIVARGKTGALKKIGHTDKLVDFTYIDDAAQAHLDAADSLSRNSSVAGRVYFITQGEPVPLWDFLNRVLQTANLPAVTATISPRVAYLVGCLLEGVYRALPLSGEPRLTRFLAEELSTAHWFDISAARRDLGYTPVTSIDDGLRRLTEWFDTEPGHALLR